MSNDNDLNPRNTVLVLGATGTVGSALSARLVEAGQRVKAATREPARYAGPAETTRLDLADPTTFAPALAGVDRLFVLAPPGYADQYALLKPFLDAALSSAHAIDRVVLMTAQGVDASDQIPFRRLERFVESREDDFVHLRPSWFYQNFHTFWGHGVREHGVIALPADDAKVAFIDARDIADAACGALTREDIETNRAYVLTGPEALTHAEAAAVLSEATGRDIRYRSIDEDAFRAQLAPSGLPPDYIELLVGLFAAVRMGAASEVTGAVATLAQHPARSLAAYASDHRAALG